MAASRMNLMRTGVLGEIRVSGEFANRPLRPIHNQRACIPGAQRAAEGEARARGKLLRIDCNKKGVVFTVQVGEQTLKLRSDNFERVTLNSYTSEVDGQIACNQPMEQNSVVVSYRPAKERSNEECSNEERSGEYRRRDACD